MSFKSLLTAAAAVVLLAGSASAAPINAPPPAGGRQLIDMADIGVTRLGGQPQPTLVFTRFVATSNLTRFTFAMRADSSFSFDAAGGEHIVVSSAFLDNISVERVNPQTNVVLSGNLITNGDFEGGQGGNLLPNGWIFDEPDPRVGLTGQVTTNTLIPGNQAPPVDGGPIPPNHSFFSFNNNAYNALSQTIATNVGATYEVGFFAFFTDNHERNVFGIDTTDFSRLAGTDTSGRQLPNGLDVVLTATDAGRGTHDDGHVHFSQLEGGAGVPEPATWAMLIAGFALVGGAARRRRRSSLA